VPPPGYNSCPNLKLLAQDYLEFFGLSMQIQGNWKSGNSVVAGLFWPKNVSQPE
jgi:hypothetical protein